MFIPVTGGAALQNIVLSFLPLIFPWQVPTVANSQEQFMTQCLMVFLIYVCSHSLQIKNDEDVLWGPDVIETDESVVARGMNLFDW